MNICNKIEILQYNAALAFTGAIRGLSKEKLYQELGFEYLGSRRWLRKLCLFYKIFVSHQTIFITMFQQLINPIKLAAVTNFYICVAEQNILRTHSFHTQSRNGII